MRVLIFGRDERYEEVIQFFKTEDYEIDIAEERGIQIDVSRYDVIVFPIPGISNGYFAGSTLLSPDFLNDSKEKVKIFSGIRTACLSEMLRDSRRTCIYFMEDDDVARENAIPTVEGIIADLIINTKITINNADIMVIGYGKVGKLLVSALKNLGATLYVGVEKESDIMNLKYSGITSFLTSDEIMKEYVKIADMVINTVPSLVLKEEHIVRLSKDVYVLDISSYPYGIDQEALKQNDIFYKIYLKIPSIVAPRTSGKILANKINSVIKNEEPQ